MVVRKIRVGYRTFRLRKLDRVARHEYEGRTQRYEGMIEYDSHSPREEKVNTLVHELVHCLMDIWGQKDADEALTGALANGLVASMQDNPELWRWLVKHA